MGTGAMIRSLKSRLSIWNPCTARARDGACSYFHVLRLAATSFVASICVGIAEALVTDPEMLGAALLVSLFVFPSIAIAAVLCRLPVRFRRVKDLIFLLSLAPIGGGAIFSAQQGGEAEDMARVLGIWYLLQALVAYMVLMACPCQDGEVKRAES